MALFVPPTPSRPGSRASLLKAASALGALALVLSSCGSSDDDAPAKADEPSYDHTAMETGAGWLGQQVTNGAVHNDQYGFDDYGLSVDVALALDAVDAEPGTVDDISHRLASHVRDYTSPGYGTTTSAGSTAKAIVLAEATGADPADFGGTDLVAQLEGRVAGDGPSSGRVQDEVDTSVKNAADYANVIAQAYAVKGLDEAGSDSADAAAEYLLAQQCEEGFFRLTFTADPGAADQTCDGDKASKPDVDATAFAVWALADRSDDEATGEQLDKAVAWLEDNQATDGSFGGSTPTTTPNSNSTGLVGWVLGETGETDTAERAATWVRQHQALDGDCASYDASVDGAIAYDDTALQQAAQRGITAKTADQFRRASAQALPVLQWLPADATASASGSC